MKQNGFFAAYDIGGTKCAALIGYLDDTTYRILGRRCFATATYPDAGKCIVKLGDELLALQRELNVPLLALGISCGGPLDAKKGVVMSPPNLPEWDNIPVCAMAEAQTGLPAFLENDANAGAVAEWRYGAGRGVDNMIFLTFGTGLGAGVIIDGRLIRGAGGNAGELGHIRLAEDGPTGYGKAGSFEGFCSGAGLARQMRSLAEERMKKGSPLWGVDSSGKLSGLDVRLLNELASSGDPDALQLFAECGRMLGRGLAVAVDLFNPQKIVIGSIFVRCGKFIRPAMMETLEKEALAVSLADAGVYPAELGEAAGDVAALCVARENFMKG